jgi:hypothetical protein
LDTTSRIRSPSVTAAGLPFPAPPLTKEIAMTISRVLTCATSLAAALWLPCALAADPPAAKTGDDALTCDQIYAQVDADVQRAQQERDKKAEELRNQGRATKTLGVAALLAGGMGGTGQAYQAAAEAQANGTMAMSAPPPNPRTEHLKQLWAQKHCVKK